MTDKTARQEARIAADAGFCGFCFAAGKPLAHKADCKLVREHGRRVISGLRIRAAAGERS